jgi:hypothetical protein
MTQFVIEIQDQENKKLYVGGPTEDSAYSLTYRVQSALWFATEEEVDAVLQHDEFTKRVVFSDGSSAPPSQIWSGLGVCNVRPRADGFINILRIEICKIKSTRIQNGMS